MRKVVLWNPYPEAVADADAVELREADDTVTRTFVPERTCERVWYGLTRNYVCSLCGAGMPKGADRYVYLHYCPYCGARVTRDESKA